MSRAAAPGRVLAALLAALLLPGCLTLRETFLLELDGSGSVRLQHDFDPGALAALRTRVHAAFAEGPGGTGGGAAEPAADPTANPVAPTWLTASARGGKEYRLTKTETAPLAGGRTRTTAEGLFPSLESAAQGGAFFGADVHLERLPKNAWLFTLRDPWTPTGQGTTAVFGGVEGAEVRARFAADLKALSRVLTITFPVPVQSTNGTLSEDRRTVTWISNADEATPHALSARFVLPPESAWSNFYSHADLGALARRCVVAPPPAPPATKKEAPPAPAAGSAGAPPR